MCSPLQVQDEWIRSLGILNSHFRASGRIITVDMSRSKSSKILRDVESCRGHSDKSRGKKDEKNISVQIILTCQPGRFAAQTFSIRKAYMADFIIVRNSRFAKN